MSLFLYLFVLIAGTFATQSNDVRIVGGHDALRGQFPHQASLRSSNGTNHFCGGSIIGRRFLLTAAHCTQGQYSVPRNVRVVVGALRFTGADGTTYAVDRIVNHPNFIQSTLANDIAVVRTSRTIWFTALVRPIELPTRDVSTDNQMAVTVSGWGQIRAGAPTPNNRPATLQWMNTVILNRRECVRRLGQNGRWVHENSLCTTNQRNTGVCGGDAGSPLKTQDFTEILIGVVSWKVPCARGYPDVYTRVYPHMQFIRRAMRD